MILNYFNTDPFIKALKTFFEELHIPINYIDDAPAFVADILGEKYKPENSSQELIEDIYVLGLVNDSAFSGKGDTKRSRM